MATQKGGSSNDKKGKKEHKNKLTSKKYKHFKIDGDNISRSKCCPRCGPGIFLADHKTRVYCGKCHYTEFIGKTDKTEENVKGDLVNKTEENVNDNSVDKTEENVKDDSTDKTEEKTA